MKKFKIRQKNNKRKKIIIILIFTLILLIVVLVSLIKKNKNNKNNNNENIIIESPSFDEFIEEYQNKVIYPRNMSEMLNFEGDTSTQIIYESFRVFVDYISYLDENIEISDSKVFFNEKSEEIKNNLGITEEEKFIELVTYLKENDIDLNDFRYAEVELNSSYVEKRYFKFILNLYYGEENETLKFKVSFAEKKNNRIPVIYEVIK